MPYLVNQYTAGENKKISRTATISRYLCEKIDENQEIRRLCRYLTLDPLADYAFDYGNNVFMQPDLNDSLMENIKTDNVSKGCEKRILYKTMFSGKVIETLNPLIYVYCDQVSFYNQRGSTSTVGTMLYYIDIIYDISTEELIDWQYRSWTIGQIIMNMFDEVPVSDENYVKEIGNISFRVGEMSITNKKLSPNTSLGVLSIPLYAVVTGGRY